MKLKNITLREKSKISKTNSRRKMIANWKEPDQRIWEAPRSSSLNKLNSPTQQLSLSSDYRNGPQTTRRRRT